MEKPVHGIARPLEGVAAGIGLQDKQRKNYLQTQAPGHDLEADRAAVGGKQVGNAHDRQQTQNSRQSPHACLLISVLLTYDLLDQLGKITRRFGHNAKGLLNQVVGPRKSLLGIVMNGAQCLAAPDAVAGLLVENQADGVVDGVLFFLPAAPEHNTRGTKLLAIHAGYKSIGIAGYIQRIPRERQARGIIHDALVAALEPDDLAEFIM